MSAFSAEGDFVPRLPAHPLRADARISPSFGRRIAKSSHSILVSFKGLELDAANPTVYQRLMTYWNGCKRSSKLRYRDTC
jgi:hypothetical protein